MTNILTELVFGLMLGISRSIPEAHATLQRGEWAKSRFNGHTLAGKTLGVIGFGSVGQEVRCISSNKCIACPHVCFRLSVVVLSMLHLQAQRLVIRALHLM